MICNILGKTAIKNRDRHQNTQLPLRLLTDFVLLTTPFRKYNTGWILRTSQVTTVEYGNVSYSIIVLGSWVYIYCTRQLISH